MTFEFRCAKTRVRPSEWSLSWGEIHATLFVVSNVTQKHGPTLHLRMVFRHCFDRKTSRSGKRQGIHQVDGVFDDRSRPRMAQFSFQSYIGDNFTIGGATGVMDYPCWLPKSCRPYRWKIIHKCFYNLDTQSRIHDVASYP